MTKQKKVVFLFSFPSFLCKKYFLSSYYGYWIWSEALESSTWEGLSWGDHVCRMDPPLPCSSVTNCLFSCPEFFCGMNNNKSTALAGPGVLGHALGRVQAGNSGGKHVSSDDSGNHTLPPPLLVCRRWSGHSSLSPLLPSPLMWLNSAGLGTVVRCEKDWQSLAPVRLRPSHANVLSRIAKRLLETVFCPYFQHF